MQDIFEVKKPEQATSEESKTKNKFSRKFIPWVLLVVVVAAGAGGTFYYKNRAEKVEADPTSVQKAKNQAETDRVLTALKQRIAITETEAPTVARVEDPEKLKKSNAEFYKNVQKDDYLVIYPKRAIIYRESNNQIINIAPIINTSDLEKKKKEQSDQPAASTTETTETTGQ